MTLIFADVFVGLGLLVIVFINVGLALGFREVDDRLLDAWEYWSQLAYTLACAYITCRSVAEGKYVRAGVYVVLTAVAGYFWWNNDRNKRWRKKLRDRLAERVTDVGGRLKVVQPAR